MAKGGGGSHWAGCHEAHHDCAAASVNEARRLMTLALDFWSAPGIDMPSVDTFDDMVRFLEMTGDPFKCKWDEEGNYIGDPTRPVGLTSEEHEDREEYVHGLQVRRQG
jgi:hypothetical protein